MDCGESVQNSQKITLSFAGAGLELHHRQGHSETEASYALYHASESSRADSKMAAGRP
jgi:hypothetical protein